VHFLAHVFDYLTSSSNWSGPEGLGTDIVNQLKLSAAALVAAIVVGVGAGALLGHSGRGSLAVVNLANAARAVPSFALLTLLAIQPAIVKLQEGGFLAAGITMFALAVPPILTNAYVGVRNVEEPVRSAALAMGMQRHQVLWRVELPLALPLVMAGVRTASVEVVATATLAAYVGVNDIGFLIFSGLANQNSVETFSGALVVAILALGVDQLLARLQWAVAPGRPKTSLWLGRGGPGPRPTAVAVKSVGP
jgi:osmoprotectant transport system permease protein